MSIESCCTKCGVFTGVACPICEPKKTVNEITKKDYGHMANILVDIIIQKFDGKQSDADNENIGRLYSLAIEMWFQPRNNLKLMDSFMDAIKMEMPNMYSYIKSAGFSYNDKVITVGYGDAAPFLIPLIKNRLAELENIAFRIFEFNVKITFNPTE